MRPGSLPPTPAIGLDDTLAPLQDPGHPDAPEICDPAPQSAAPGILAWQRLSAIAADCAACIELEPADDARPARLALLRGIARLWNQGRRGEAIRDLRAIEEGGGHVGLGIQWPPEGAPGRFRDGVDHRIGSPRTDARTVALDFDEETGNLFSVIRWQGDPSDSYWTVNLSTDHGDTWTETFSFFSSVGIVDTDAAVVGDWVYTGYVVGNAPAQLRVRRAMAANGASDGAYGYEVAVTSATEFTDVAVTANSDDFDNRIYVVGIDTGHVLRHAWDAAADGTAWTEVPPPAQPNANYGLDAAWHNGFTSGTPHLYISYSGTDESIHVLRLMGTAWTDNVIDIDNGPLRDTSISSNETNIICAYEAPLALGTGIAYGISYNGGTNWSYAIVAEPDDETTFSFSSPSVDARNGLGTAIVYQAEMGEPDEAYYQFRTGFAPGPWEAPSAFADYDVTTGSDTDLAPLSHGAPFFDLGAIYAGNGWNAYFDRPHPQESSVPEPTGVAARLMTAAPNPFLDRTVLRFTTPATEAVRLELFDVLGRRVRTLVDGVLEAGTHSVALDGGDLRSAVYFCRLTVGSRSMQRQVIRLN